MEAWIEIISNFGFPIACVFFMGLFIYHIYQTTTNQNTENMEKVQARCAEREDKLYEQLAETRQINRKAIDTIAHYAEKLDTIQGDINDIKTDITVIMTKN